MDTVETNIIRRIPPLHILKSESCSIHSQKIISVLMNVEHLPLPSYYLIMFYAVYSIWHLICNTQIRFTLIILYKTANMISAARCFKRPNHQSYNQNFKKKTNVKAYFNTCISVEGAGEREWRDNKWIPISGLFS